jgi:pimeloyl-ACP methyl ester carboxylesterase
VIRSRCSFLLVASVLLLARVDFAHAAACTTATMECAEWVSVGGGAQRNLVYRTHALHARNEQIQRALIMVHGQSRTSRNFFRTALAAAFLAGALENTLVIAPRFASNEGKDCRDKLAPEELNWVCSGPESWRNGGPAVNAGQVTSYHVTDEILRLLARKDVFPNLRSIVLAGHSAGGQYTTRYAMANQSHDRIGISLRYVVANPSSYTYLNAVRPTVGSVSPGASSAQDDDASPAAPMPSIAFQSFPGPGKCTGFDDWPYGLQKRVGYSAHFPTEQLIRQATTRPTTFLVGEYDVLPDYGFESSCAAMAQGPTRLARGLAYARYLNESYGAKHQAIVVPACGHNARCIFTTNLVLRVLFPNA